MRVLASKGSLTCKHLRRTRPRRHTHCSLASHKQDQSKVIVKNQPKVTRQSLEKSLKINLSHSKVENHSKSYSKLELQEQPQNDLCTSSDVFKSIALLFALLSLNNAIIYPKNRQSSSGMHAFESQNGQSDGQSLLFERIACDSREPADRHRAGGLLRCDSSHCFPCHWNCGIYDRTISQLACSVVFGLICLPFSVVFGLTVR